jgi:hypothetical protein
MKGYDKTAARIRGRGRGQGKGGEGPSSLVVSSPRTVVAVQYGTVRRRYCT